MLRITLMTLALRVGFVTMLGAGVVAAIVLCVRGGASARTMRTLSAAALVLMLVGTLAAPLRAASTHTACAAGGECQYICYAYWTGFLSWWDVLIYYGCWCSEYPSLF